MVKPVAVETGVLKVGIRAGARVAAVAGAVGRRTEDRTRTPNRDAIRLSILDDGRDFWFMRSPSKQLGFWTSAAEVSSPSTFNQRIPGFLLMLLVFKSFAKLESGSRATSLQGE